MQERHDHHEDVPEGRFGSMRRVKDDENGPRLRHIEILMDRSGSMGRVKDNAEDGLRSFLDEQWEVPVLTTVSLSQFDHALDVVYEVVPLHDTPAYTLQPRGTTALLDAAGLTINRLMRQLADTPKSWRPDEIIMVILTDGRDNDSHRISPEKLNQKIARRRLNDGWRFVFLGADQDAYAVAASMGISPHTAMSYSSDRTEDSLTTAGRMVARGTRTGNFEFTDEERESAQDL